MKYCLYFAKNILNNAGTDDYLLKYSLKDITGYFNNHILVCFSCKYMYFTNKHFVDYKTIDINKFDKNQHISISIYLFIYSLILVETVLFQNSVKTKIIQLISTNRIRRVQLNCQYAPLTDSLEFFFTETQCLEQP